MIIFTLKVEICGTIAGPKKQKENQEYNLAKFMFQKIQRLD